jgi:hypothetical protein
MDNTEKKVYSAPEKQVYRISEKHKCPDCEHGLYTHWFTPAGDHPELGIWYVECRNPEKSHELEATFGTIEELMKEFEIEAEPMEQKDTTKELDHVKSFTIKLEFYKDGTQMMHRVNDGFNPLELLGLSCMVTQEIIDTIKGHIKPDVIKRDVVIP